MRTRLLQFIIPILMLPSILSGQCFENVIPDGGDCGSALFLCGYYLDGYTGSLTSDVATGNQPENLCTSAGDVDNIQWFSFIACESTVELLITPSDCQAVLTTQSGLQTGIYEDCTFENPLECYSEAGEDPITLSLTDAVPGSIYYLFVDGYAASLCDFSIEVITGIDISPPIMADPIELQLQPDIDTICTGDMITFHFPIDQLPSINQCGPSNEALSDSDLEYLACIDWIVNDNVVQTGSMVGFDVTSDAHASSIDLIFHDEGDYNITAELNYNPAIVGNGPDGAPLCGGGVVTISLETLTVLQRQYELLTPITLCEGQEYEFCGITYNESGTYYCEDSDSTCLTLIQEIIINTPQNTDLGTIFLCNDECFTHQGETYCDIGNYEIADNADCNITYSFKLADLQSTVSYTGEDQLDCGTSSITLNPSIQTNSTLPLVYTWYDSDDIPVGSAATLNVTDEGTYTLVAGAHDILPGCEIRISIPITKDENTPEVEISTPTLNCDQLQDVLTLESDLDILSVLWEGPNGFESNLISPEVSDTGSYTVTIVATNGCTTIEERLVSGDFEAPEAEPVYTDIDCFQEWTSLSYITNDNIRSQEWIHTDFASDEAMTQSSNPGMYTLLVTGTNGCTAEIPFEVKDERNYPIVDLGPDMLWQCNTTSLDLLANVDINDRQLSWEVNTGVPLTVVDDLSATAYGAGEYTLSVTDMISGCETIDTIRIVPNEDVPQGIIGEIYDPICFEESSGYIDLQDVDGGEAPYIISIDNRNLQVGEVLDELSAGVYEVMITDAHGCLYTEMITLENPEEIIIDAPDKIEISYYIPGHLEVEHNYADADISSISWYDGQGDWIADGASIEVAETRTTYYRVELTTIEGCTASRSIKINVDTSVEIFAPNIFSPNNDGHNDKFWVRAKDDNLMVSSMYIYDRWGSIVYAAEDMPATESSVGWDGTLNGQKLNPGVYVYVITIQATDESKHVFSGDITLVR